MNRKFSRMMIGMGCLLAVLWGVSPAHAYTVGLYGEPSEPIEGPAGGTITAHVKVGVADGESLASADIQVKFDPSVLAFVKVYAGPDAPGTWDVQGSTPCAGDCVTITAMDFDLNPLIGKGLYGIADIDFLIRNVASGTTTDLVPVSWLFGDDILGIEVDTASEVKSVRVLVTGVTPIPEPSTFLLLGGGLIAWAGGRRLWRRQGPSGSHIRNKY